MRPLLKISGILSAMLTLGAIGFSQTDPKNVPQPPTEELRKFDPFLGKYKVSGEYANLPWTGTLELQKVIKGWYIQSLAIHATRVPESSAERSQQSNNQSSAAPALAAQTPQPAPEMQSLTKALAGRWSINLKHEPNERNPNGAASDGEEVWRSGPGEFTFVEEIQENTPGGELGLGLMWWDKTKGFQGLWCDNRIQGCDPTATFHFKWDGQQLVIDYESDSGGKKFVGHEVYSDITPATFTQTLDIGEFGGPLKRRLTIHAARVPELSTGTVPQSSNPPVGSQATAVRVSQVGPEMQRIVNALSGTWSFTIKNEPSQQRPSGDAGQGVEVWRASPGGMLIEDNHMKTRSGESYDSAAIWWDEKARKYSGIWCADINDEGCSGFDAKWDGNQLVLDGVWEQSGKRRAWHEVFVFATPTSCIQTLDVGEPGGELKRAGTLRATKVTEASLKPTEQPSGEAEILAAMDERRKASMEGDTEKVTSSLADEYLQTDIGGYVQDKATWLNEYFKPLAELIKAGKFHWEVYDRKDVQIRIYGDCAVVIGTLEAKGSGARYVPTQHTWMADPSASFSGTLRFTHVNIKRNGKWLLAALHNQLPPPPPTNK